MIVSRGAAPAHDSHEACGLQFFDTVVCGAGRKFEPVEQSAAYGQPGTPASETGREPDHQSNGKRRLARKAARRSEPVDRDRATKKLGVALAFVGAAPFQRRSGQPFGDGRHQYLVRVWICYGVKDT